MGIERCIAVPGKVLGCRRDARAFRTAHPRRRELRHALGVVAERPGADNRVPRLDVDIAHRCVIHGDAVDEQSFGNRARGALGVARIAGRRDGHGARKHRAVSDPNDGPAFLVDRHRHGR